ncbi:MAG: hypothetical protein AB7W59_02930 [Acidimicrobiia bacterium]
MIDVPSILEAVIEELDEHAVCHMLAGSFASSIHGAPRATNDVDLVIDPAADRFEGLLESLAGRGLYVPFDAARRALSERDQFNVLDTNTGWKVDLIIRKARPFSVAEFERRRPVDLGSVIVFVASAEDTILAKLEWAASSGSVRQQRDVEEITDALRATLDWRYLDRWAPDLGVEEAVRALRRRLEG